MTTSQTNNKVFKGTWTCSQERDAGTNLLHDGNVIASFEPDTHPRIIEQILTFAQLAHNLEINLVEDRPQLHITIDHELLEMQQSKLISVIEVTRHADEQVARFATTVTAHIGGNVSADIWAHNVVRTLLGSFDYPHLDTDEDEEDEE